LRLAGDGDGNYGSGPLVENVVAQNQNRAKTALFTADDRI
jgi:hypothetical protein